MESSAVAERYVAEVNFIGVVGLVVQFSVGKNLAMHSGQIEWETCPAHGSRGLTGTSRKQRFGWHQAQTTYMTGRGEGRGREGIGGRGKRVQWPPSGTVIPSSYRDGSLWDSSSISAASWYSRPFREPRAKTALFSRAMEIRRAVSESFIREREEVFIVVGRKGLLRRPGSPA
jgi:hypothetical protein